MAELFAHLKPSSTTLKQTGLNPVQLSGHKEHKDHKERSENLVIFVIFVFFVVNLID